MYTNADHMKEDIYNEHKETDNEVKGRGHVLCSDRHASDPKQ